MELYIIYALGVLVVWLWTAGAFATIALSFPEEESTPFFVLCVALWPLIASIGMALALRDRIQRR